MQIIGPHFSHLKNRVALQDRGDTYDVTGLAEWLSSIADFIFNPVALFLNSFFSSDFFWRPFCVVFFLFALHRSIH